MGVTDENRTDSHPLSIASSSAGRADTLRHLRFRVERATRIELAFSAWEGANLA